MGEKVYPVEMHTAEHVLNQTMVRMFGCGRSFGAHIERRKSKCDYNLPHSPTEEQVCAVESEVNAVLALDLPVSERFVDFDEAKSFVDVGKLPPDHGDRIRIVSVGDYDHCACIGPHVERTSQVGRFVVISWSYDDGVFRLRFKLEPLAQ